MLRFMCLVWGVTVMLVLAPLRPVMAEALFTGPEPDWVMPLDVPVADEAVRAAVTDGVLTLLSDEQVRWDAEERQVYTRTVRLITDAAGVAVAARVVVPFAQGSETLILTRVAVTRAGQVTDLTETVVSQTRDMGAGQSAAEVQVPDVQPGDVVELAYLRRQLPAVAGANRAGVVQIERDVPVQLARVVVNWPESWPIYISGWPSRVGFVQDTAPGVVRHIWTRAGHVPLPPEPMVPPGYSANVQIAYSAFPDWSGVTGALSGHYMESYPLGAAWDARLRAIQAEFQFPDQRVIAALRAVQDDLGYEARPLAVHGWLARLPAEVAEAGVGDAMDKALLLRTMLDKMGIEAYVALTSSTQSHDLNQRKPAFEVLDHALVKAVVDGVIYWLDASASGEAGDLYTAAVPDFGYALPLAGKDQQQLEPIDQGYASSWTVYVEEDYNFTLLGAYLTVVTTHYGPAANAMRVSADAGAFVQDKADLQVMAARYPGVRMLGAVAVADDPVGNQITVTARYLLPAAARQFVVQTENPVGYLAGAGQGARLAPLYLGRPLSVTHRATIRNAPWDIEPPFGANIYNDAFSYAFSGYLNAPRELVLDWTFTQYLRSVPPDMADQIIRDAAIIDENDSFSFGPQP